MYQMDALGDFESLAFIGKLGTDYVAVSILCYAIRHTDATTATIQMTKAQ